MFFNIFLELGLFLVLLLAVLLVLLFRRAKEERDVYSRVQKDNVLDLKKIVEKIRLDIQSTQELEESIDLVLQNYGTIDDFTLYEELLKALIVSPHTNKKIILSFDKELSHRNPTYKKRISDTVVEALDLR